MSDKTPNNDKYTSLTLTPDRKYDFFNLDKTPSNKENSQNNKDDQYQFYLYQSPSSLEQFIDSFSRNKVRIVKEIPTEQESYLFNTPKVNQSIFKEVANRPTGSDEKITSSNNILFTTSMLQKRERGGVCLFSPDVSKIKKLDLYADNQSTLFSTNKKLRRQRKSKNQVNLLKEYMKKHGTDWTKEVLDEVSSKCSLSQGVIYKWLWDQKNKN
jgi:hypothetical protein